MFEGGAFGVGVTVASVDPEPWPAELVPRGHAVRPTRLGEMMPVSRRSDADLARELQRVQQAEAQLAAYKVELVSELASRRPDTADRSPDQAGAAAPGWTDHEPTPGVSEFFADELALILNCSRAAATALAEASSTLVDRLPTAWAALADGMIDWPRARALAAELGWAARDLPDDVVARVEAAVLPAAAEQSVTRLRAAARREVLRHDAAAADRRRAEAARAADVVVRPLRDGMAELVALLPQPLAAATRDAVDAYARLAKTDGDPRPIGSLRAGMLADLVLRPWDTSRPPVTAHLEIVAPLPTLTRRSSVAGRGPASRQVEPATVAGEPITATHVRALLEELDALCPGGLQAPDGGSVTVAVVDPHSGALRASCTPAELRRAAGERGPTASGRAASRDPVTDRAGLVSRDTARASAVGRPPPVVRYAPTPAQRRFVRTRDRTCRHPGCRTRAGWADLDHVVAHGDGGRTDCGNLCCLCRRHHRLKTHAPGWRFALSDDGVLSVTTPSGVTRSTRPPAMAGPPGRAGQLEMEPPPDPDDPPPF